MSELQTAGIWGWRGATRGLTQRTKRILGTGERSDVQFVVGQQFGEEQFFPAHKFVLSLGSDVFDRMFYGEVPEATTIPLPDILPQAFAVMLKYLYTDVVEDLSLENVMSTLNCAKKYGIPDLADSCAEYAIENVSKSACLALLEDAKVLDAENVAIKCLDMMDRHCSELLQSQEFLDLKNETLRLIFSRDTLVAKEEEVYKAAERWASNACRTNQLEPTGANYRRVLREVLFLIRFPLMEDGQLVNGPGATGLLLDEELLKIYQFKNATRKPDIPFSEIPRRSKIVFCDRQWIVLDNAETSLGKITPRNAVVNQHGHLCLRFSLQDGVWKGAAIQSVDALGFGRYEFQIEGLNRMGPGVSFALSSQCENEPGPRISLTRPWLVGFRQFRQYSQITFSVRRSHSLVPLDRNSARSIEFTELDTRSTHTYRRTPDMTSFSSQRGHQDTNATQVLDDWRYDLRTCITQKALPVSICLLEHPSMGPFNGKDVEIVVHSFRFYPAE